MRISYAIFITALAVPVLAQGKPEDQWWTGTEDRKIIEAEKRKAQERTIPWHDNIMLTPHENSYVEILNQLVMTGDLTGIRAYEVYKSALTDYRKKGTPLGKGINHGFGWDQPRWMLTNTAQRVSEMFLGMDKKAKAKKP